MIGVNIQEGFGVGRWKKRDIKKINAWKLNLVLVHQEIERHIQKNEKGRYENYGNENTPI